MSPSNARIFAALCLLFLPFAYILGVETLRNGYPILARVIIMGWMLVSLGVGIAAALTFRNHIFGLNPGSLLACSVPIITIAYTLQVSQYIAGAYIMYSLFAISFIYGAYALIKYIRTANKI